MKLLLKNIQILLLCSLSISLFSCESFIEVDSPKNQLVNAEVFSNDATALAALSGMYAGIASSGGTMAGGSSSVSILSGLAADEFDVYSNADVAKQVYQNNILPANSLTTLLWEEAYNTNYKANMIIEGLPKSGNISSAFLQQATGECLFVRAFVHFNLLNLFGDIPYINTTDYRLNTKAHRLPAKQVMELIIADLLKARDLLAADYSVTNQERIRVNKWTATALLARVYLYHEDWKNAELQADQLLNNQPLFKLTALNEVFLKNSKETIWSLKSTNPDLNTIDGVISILIAKPTWSALRSSFKFIFEEDDLRKVNWIGNFTNASGSWDFVHKYKIRQNGTPLNEYSIVLRLAEQYLIRAEARTQQGKLTEALADLDEVRTRAGLKKISEIKPEISKVDLLEAIQKERRLELFGEWGHRWFDLKRTRKADAILGALKPTWKSTAAFFPIPASEIAVNTNMVQNEGYN